MVRLLKHLTNIDWWISSLTQKWQKKSFLGAFGVCKENVRLIDIDSTVNLIISTLDIQHIMKS